MPRPRPAGPLRDLQAVGGIAGGNALDPDLQDQTDDFTGFIAHSVNLAFKGIIGIGAMSRPPRWLAGCPSRTSRGRPPTAYPRDIWHGYIEAARKMWTAAWLKDHDVPTGTTQ
ncbi:glutaminase domain-containing protein [Amycolatopsis vastitatis]|uniref:glutaminase domain-containing protein n=1 Tax=Amycolatopsis vastitatis TaxID=1905142 RepID=UPI003F6CC16F